MQVRQVQFDKMFPSGDGQPLITVRFSPEQLAEHYGLTFEEAHDALDYYKLAAIALPNGAQAWLIRYRGNPLPGTVVYVDARANMSRAAALVKQVLGLSDTDVIWTSPSVSAVDPSADTSAFGS